MVNAERKFVLEIICNYGEYPKHCVMYYRPKYMIDKMIVYPRYAKGSNKDVIKDLIFVVLDDVGSSNYGFTLSETTKDSNSQGTLKVSKNSSSECPSHLDDHDCTL